jgi:Zn-dependent alcohol dehydrogenase
MGSSNIQIDIPNLVNLYLTGRLKLDELISNRYSLDQINEALADSATGQSIRNVIMF